MKTSLLITGGLAFGAMTFAQEKPNIIVILADDLGFSDLGCYGGEVQTPVLDKMAKQGVRMTQMYNSARSCPSRANLLTGLYPHQTGLGHMDATRPAWPKGYAGFRSNSDNVTIAEVLKDAGYFTAMSGKWHLGKTANPINRGFLEYYGLLGGFNSFWNPDVYTRLPKDRNPRQYKEGEFYATNVITDYAIDFINQAHQEEKPLFLYLAYNAAHFPLHAPKEVTDKYMKIYLQGWDKIRDQRWKRIVKMGLLQGKPALSPRGVVPESLFEDETHPLPAWDSLTKEQQTDLARRMAIYAAMIDIMDTNIGRVLDTLQKNGELDNTFIMFMSDNGACAEWHEFGFDKQTGTEYHTHVGAELDQMGLPGTYHHYGTGWANVCCTPFTLYNIMRMKVEYPLLALSSGVNRLSTKAVLTINRHNSRISWQLASNWQGLNIPKNTKEERLYLHRASQSFLLYAVKKCRTVISMRNMKVIVWYAKVTGNWSLRILEVMNGNSIISKKTAQNNII